MTGAVLLAGALVAVAYPLLEGRSLGWPAWTWLLLAVGLVLLAALGVVEERRQHARVAPLLRTGLFRIPAFTAGLTVMLAFSAGLQGFFLVFAVWLQVGMRYSPLAAGLTALAFSAGSFLLASGAVPLAQRYGRYVLAGGGLLLAAGIGAIGLGAGHVGTAGNPWPVVPGLVLAGAGLSLLVIPLANVVLAAVPIQTAGGASGLFSTAQQLGGALGVAVLGTIFFGELGEHSFTRAFTDSMPVTAGLFLAAAALSLILPRAVVADEHA